MLIRSRLLVAAAALAPLVLLGSPATAVGSSQIAFQGDVTLPVFPCAGSDCVAYFTASLTAGAGIATSTAAAVVTGLSARVNYNETCAGGQAVTGTALGVATLTGVNVTGMLLPLSVPFLWNRAGLVAVITSNPVSSTTPAITGAAVFVPAGGLPTCTGGSTTATISGKAYLCFFTTEGVACAYTRAVS